MPKTGVQVSRRVSTWERSRDTSCSIIVMVRDESSSTKSSTTMRSASRDWVPSRLPKATIVGEARLMVRVATVNSLSDQEPSLTKGPYSVARSLFSSNSRLIQEVVNCEMGSVMDCQKIRTLGLSHMMWMQECRTTSDFPILGA